jgi:hypothetical protein
MDKQIKISSNAVTATSSVAKDSNFNERFSERSESTAERVAKWYISPLREMSGSKGFIVLMVLLPLYENTCE